MGGVGVGVGVGAVGEVGWVGEGGHMVRFSWSSALSRFGGSFSLREHDLFFLGNSPLRCRRAAVPKHS